MVIRKGAVVASMLGVVLAVVQACATSPSIDDEGDDSGRTAIDAARVETGSGPPAVTPAVTDTGTPDTSGPDTSTPEASTGVDSGLVARPGDPFDPLAPKSGDPCPATVAVNDVVSRRCGKCGQQSALCEPGRTIGVYGACQGEITAADACLPNETIASECGFCGTRFKICEPTCVFREGSCLGEVPNGCAKGSVTYLERLCGPMTVPPSAPTDVRRQSCSATCTKDPPEACAPRPLDELVASPTVGVVVSGEFSYLPTKVGRLALGDCATTTETAVQASVHYARIKNNGTESLNVTVVNRPIAGASSVPDVAVTMYPGPGIPADRTECVGVVRSTPEAFTVDIPAGGQFVFHTIQNATVTPTRLKLDVLTNYVGAGPRALTLPAGPNLTTSTEVVQDATRKAARLSVPISGFGTCPTTLLSTLSPYAYVEVHNPSATARTIDLATTGADGIMAVYPGNVPPADDTARLACMGATNDYCPVASNPGGAYNMCLLGVRIPASSSIMVYVANVVSTNTESTILQVTTKD